MRANRREFLGRSVVAAGSLGFLAKLAPVSAEEAKLPASLVKYGGGVEATVKLLEETPREKLLEEVGDRIKRGLSYRELLAALLVAGVRNVQPRPQVGFKFHAVLVINSAHLASMASPAEDRWLPIFWALDRFKSAQMETLKESGWRMGKVEEGRVPAGSKAREAFVAAMEAWDEGAADAAAAGLARTASRNECFELFCRYGARDWRDIGHKAIFVANSFRTLECVGWQHAEPVLRSLAYALLKYDGENPAKSDQAADRPGRTNAELVKRIRADWQDGKADEGASLHLLETLRTASSDEMCAAVVEALNKGVAASSVWDALLSGSAELLMRKTGIVTLHSVTSSNALRFAYETSVDPQTRLMMLLQNAAFVPLFRGAAGKLSDRKIDAMEGAGGGADVGAVFANVGKDRPAAAGRALAYLDGGSDAGALMNQARRWVFLKGNDAHDYKYSSAVLEDYRHVSEKWRNRFLASSLFYLPGEDAKDNQLVGRVRAALG